MSIRSLLLGLAVLSAPLVSTEALAEERSVTYYETLSPHGDWVIVSSYGRVWRPHRHLVGEGFIPYASGGRWAHTPLGWVFEAQWEWAWLPFHYGRWYEDELNGWVWVPGDVWAPAWVEWRFGGGYIGWVPSGPAHYTTRRWYFVQQAHFAEPQIWQHRATAISESTALQATRPIAPPSGSAWSPGPSIEQVRATSRVEIPERKLAPPPALPRGVGAFPEGLPAGNKGPREPMKMNGRPPVPAEAMPAPPPRFVPENRQPNPVREPSRIAPEQRQPNPVREPSRIAPEPRQPNPVREPSRMVPDQRQPPPIREPSKPAQEPFRPMIELTPQGQPQQAPAKKKTPQPQGPPGPARGPGPMPMGGPPMGGPPPGH